MSSFCHTSCHTARLQIPRAYTYRAPINTARPWVPRAYRYLTAPFKASQRAIGLNNSACIVTDVHCKVAQADAVVGSASYHLSPRVEHRQFAPNTSKTSDTCPTFTTVYAVTDNAPDSRDELHETGS